MQQVPVTSKEVLWLAWWLSARFTALVLLCVLPFLLLPALWHGVPAMVQGDGGEHLRAELIAAFTGRGARFSLLLLLMAPPFAIILRLRHVVEQVARHRLGLSDGIRRGGAEADFDIGGTEEGTMRVNPYGRIAPYGTVDSSDFL